MKETAPFHVLLVEDDPGDALLCKELLKGCNGSTQLAHVVSMTAAMEYIAQGHRLDTVLFDFAPDAAGLESLQEICAAVPYAPIIVLVSPDDEETARQALREGGHEYLVKGETDARLLKRILRFAAERKQIQDQLQREKVFTAAMLRNSYDGMAVVSGSGRFKFISPAMRPILQLDPDGNVTLDSWISDSIRKKEQREAFSEKWKRLCSSGESFEMILEIVRPSGGLNWSRLRLAAMSDEDCIITGQDVTLSIQTQDQLTFINELLAKQNEQLQRMATTDQLTGVLNRSTLHSVAGQQWSRAVRKKECFSLIMMDIDRLERVNDAHGHLVGDMVLERMGHMLNTLTRAYDLIGRWGGEEFLVVLPGTSIDDAMLVAERIRAGVSEMDVYVDDRTTLKVTCSFGVAGRSETGVAQLDILFAQVDTALNCAKQSGRNRVCRQQGDDPAAA